MTNLTTQQVREILIGTELGGDLEKQYVVSFAVPQSLLGTPGGGNNSGFSFGAVQLDIANNSIAKAAYGKILDDALNADVINDAQFENLSRYSTAPRPDTIPDLRDRYKSDQEFLTNVVFNRPSAREIVDEASLSHAEGETPKINELLEAVSTKWGTDTVFDASNPGYYQAASAIVSINNRTGNLSGATRAFVDSKPDMLSDVRSYFNSIDAFNEEDWELVEIGAERLEAAPTTDGGTSPPVVTAPPAPPMAEAPSLTVGELIEQPGSFDEATELKPIRELELQIIEQLNLLAPDSLISIEDLIGSSDDLLLFLQKPAKDALAETIKDGAAKGLEPIQVNSAYRTVASQHLLKEDPGPGVSLAAEPGKSNHESGFGLDIGNWQIGWGDILKDQGWVQPYPDDAVHFDYLLNGVDPGLNDRGVEAFQRLWNINHPEDRIDEDGAFGPATEDRLNKSPIEGFSMTSAQPPTAGPAVPSTEPPPTASPAVPSTDYTLVDGTGARSEGVLTPTNQYGPGVTRGFNYGGVGGAIIQARTDNVRLQGGAGSDALVVQGGRSILDGYGGSDWLVGGTGQNLFVVDARGVTWSTVLGFKAGDEITVRGLGQDTSTFRWVSEDGANGFKGVTLRGAVNGAGQVFSLTFAGVTVEQVKRHAATMERETDGTPVLRLRASSPAAPEDTSYNIVDTRTGIANAGLLDPYQGTIAGLRHQHAETGDASIALLARASDSLLRSGTGNDALVVLNGDNVLDAGGGSNWLAGGAGGDRFLVDARAGQAVWNTVLNFHAGDDLVMRGYQEGVSSWGWTAAGEGAAGYQGATLRGALNGRDIDFSLTLAGVSVEQARSFVVSPTTASDGVAALSIRA